MKLNVPNALLSPYNSWEGGVLYGLWRDEVSMLKEGLEIQLPPSSIAEVRCVLVLYW